MMNMDAQDRHALGLQMEGVLLSAGPMFGKYPELFTRAACVYRSLVLGSLLSDKLQARAFYTYAINLHHAKSQPMQLPADALGKFPFTKPAPHLRDQKAQIEAMLAPLSDHRMRAHHAARHIQPTVAHHENRVE